MITRKLFPASLCSVATWSKVSALIFILLFSNSNKAKGPFVPDLYWVHLMLSCWDTDDIGAPDTDDPRHPHPEPQTSLQNRFDVTLN